MMSSEKLKNCPFCGSEVTLEKWDPRDDKEDIWFVIECQNAKCCCKLDQVFRTKNEAVTAWNTRPASREGLDEEKVKSVITNLYKFPLTEEDNHYVNRIAQAICQTFAPSEPLERLDGNDIAFRMQGLGFIKLTDYGCVISFGGER